MQLNTRLQRSDGDIPACFAALRTRADVADLLEIPDDYLRRILYTRREPLAYRQFGIHKRGGGTRRISVPPNALAILQAKLNHVFQIVYKRRRAAHGFVKGRSILSNASLHVGKRWVLNLDLEDFFPSINFGRVRGMLMAPPYGVRAAAATVLAQICCTDDGLPQGAPSSPMLANMVCGRLDGELTAIARRYHATYSRYGDDITFSLRRHDFPEDLAVAPLGWVGPDVSIGSVLRQVIESNGFTINPRKSRLQLCHCKQEVTGITVNVFPNVGRGLVREVRAMLHAWEKYGLDAAEREFRYRFATPDRRPGADEQSFFRTLKGKLDFIQMVRGRTDPVYVKLRAKLHELSPTTVSPPPPPLPRSATAVPGVGADPGWTRWYRRLGQSIFHLEIRNGGDTHAGTAFAYRTTHVATAAHNLVGDVRLHGGPDGGQLDGWVMHQGYQLGVDCALARVEHGSAPLEVHPHLPEPGEPLAVLGFASVPQRHPSLGIYSGAVESISRNYHGISLIQITVSSAGGLSGSPVINTAGRVIGIIVESTFEQTNIGVPSREFCTVLPIHHIAAVEAE